MDRVAGHPPTERMSPMIPETECELTHRLPDGGELWLPGAEELADDEGFGGYRETWVIRQVGFRAARRVVNRERAIVQLIEKMATSPSEFYALSAFVESADEETLADEGFSLDGDSPIREYVAEDWSATEGLDLGLSGIVYALAATGFHPMASCRGTPHTWAPFPLVRFTGRMWRARLLLPIAVEAGCGLIEEGGSLTTWAPSVMRIMDFAGLILSRRQEFLRNPDLPSRVKRPAQEAHPQLFPTSNLD